eukprot:3417587-Alexandrium_andersonii.AAC.1
MGSHCRTPRNSCVEPERTIKNPSATQPMCRAVIPRKVQPRAAQKGGKGCEELTWGDPATID